jgi:MerR family transcriptional regulator, light-induced transcriptional regulator
MSQSETWLSTEGSVSSACDPAVMERTKRRTRRRKHPSVADFVTEDIVPHLVRSLGRPRAEESASERFRFSDEMVRDFTAAVLDVDETAATRFVDELRSSGVAIDDIYLGLFSSSARLLGEYWETDRSPFAEVALALWRLHRLVRDISPAFQGEAPAANRLLQALLAPAPGEQHSFGLVLLSEYFRRAGWNVIPGPLQTNAEITRAVSADFLAIVGFSISSENNLDRLAASISTVRRKSRNRAVGVMVGGALFNERPDLVARVGADATACDAAEALAKAQRYAVCRRWGPN